MGFHDHVPPSFPPLGSSCSIRGPRLLDSRWKYLVQSVHSASEESKSLVMMLSEFLCASHQYCKLLCLIGAKRGDRDRWRDGHPSSLATVGKPQTFHGNHRIIVDPELLGGWVECA